MSKPPTPEYPEVQWVTADIIRELFNERQFFNKASAGELSTHVKRDSHRDPPPAGEPYCTRSQIVYYYDRDQNPVAIVHQYRRPDGTIGASGQPDPKRLFLENRIISIRTQPPQDK
jgi:hypothetical protein